MQVDSLKSSSVLKWVLEGWLQGLCLATRVSAHLVFPGEEIVPASFITAFIMVPCVV